MTPTTPAAAASALPTPYEDRVEWRGDVGIFPTRAGLAYREHACVIHPKEIFGDGLLAPHEHHRRKQITLPAAPAAAARVELLVFGNGLIKGPTCRVNGTELPLRTVADFTVGAEEAYPTCSYSVNRSYSFADVPAEILRSGDNTIEVGRCHAFLQTLVLRVFEPKPINPALKLTVERRDGGYRLAVKGPDLPHLREAQFFARHRGLDMEGGGRDVTWQAAVNKDSSRAEDYQVSNHCGSAMTEPWEVAWDSRLVPSGPIQFRCRVKMADGLWMESPVGLTELWHEAAQLIVPVRPQGFAPWGFHVCGANQNVDHRCEFRLVGPDFHEVERRSLRRALLALPLYGVVDLELAGRRGRHQFRVTAPLAGYHVRYVELPVETLFSRMNPLHLKSSGDTGCFQSPGPLLYMIYDR